MRGFKYHIYTGVLVIVLLLIVPYIWKLFNILFLSPTESVLSQLELYMWLVAGMFIALVLGHYLNKNLNWLKTFSHELTHTLIALLFFKKVHSFHAEEEDGVVLTCGTTKKGGISIALAPYCLPIFTYFLLAIRILIEANRIWIFDLIIGISLAFHISCFKHQTTPLQPDINQYPLFFSYTYIYVARVINFCIILVAFFPKCNVFTSTWRLLSAMYDSIILFFEWIF